MSGALNTKQWVPLSDDEREALVVEAASQGLTTGLLARALLLHALDRVGSAGVGRRVEEERAATKQRISEGARTAVRARWGSDEGSKK